MIYNNLISLLAAIFLLATGEAIEPPPLALSTNLLLFLLKAGLLWLLARRHFRASAGDGSARYFSAEQRLTIAALFSLAMDIHLLGAPFYLSRLPLAKALPFLVHLGGLILYLATLSLVWLAGRPAYQRVFARTISAASFVLANLRINLAMVFPWLVLSAAADLLRLAPLPTGLRSLLAAPWGEPLLLLLFFLLLVVLLPPAIVRLWGCAPLPDGAVRRRIESFCAGQGIAFANVLLWPLFEGRMLTAGVMGIPRRFRYLLVTPALLEAMSPEELEAVVAHELGHVRLLHLQLYLALFLGFGLLLQLGGEPLLGLLLGSDLFRWLLAATGKAPETILTFAATLTVFLLILLYFRFVFGFFMRNFERQADLHALTSIGQAGPLVRVFEKIAWLSGNIRDLPSWHHFGIGQRIDFLRRCEQEPRLIRLHHRKVWTTLALYVLLLGAGAIQLAMLPRPSMPEGAELRLAETIILNKLAEQPDNPMWLQMLGDLRQTTGHAQEAAMAYQRAVQLAPNNQEALNNLAWLLLTTEIPGLRDPAQALILAQRAAALGGNAAVLDTLALALWMNGRQAEAVEAEQAALALAEENHEFYRRQLERFQSAPPKSDANPHQENIP
ncbi:MAG: M48 family metalloprotease [Thermodesulfobacteriota bacterium]